MTVADILSIVYVLLNNAGEDELDFIIAMEQYNKVNSKMQLERVLAHKTPEIIKETVSFTDGTGIVTNTLTDFGGDVVYMKFAGESVDEASVNMLDEYSSVDIQAVAFWEDVEDPNSPVKKIELARKVNGTLTVWHEPQRVAKQKIYETAEIEEALQYMIATRVAEACLSYVHYQDPVKEQVKPNLFRGLKEDALEWRELYQEKINRIGTGKPMSRIPFRAGRGNTPWQF